MKSWRKLFKSARGGDEIEQLRGLLQEAVSHLRSHAEDYQHPGQPALIARIEAHLKRQ